MFNIGVHYRQLCACTVSLVVGTALLAPSGYTQPEPARSADDFVDSIGVNTHLFYDNSVYYQKYNQIIKPKLLELGVRHIRDGGTANLNGYLDRLKELGGLGIRSTLIFDPRDSTPQAAVALSKYLGTGVEAIEGPNEYDNSGDRNWVSTLRTYQQQLYQAIKGDYATANLPIYGPTLTSTEAANAVGDLSSAVDYATMNNYYSGRYPGTSGWGDQGYGSLAWNVQLAQQYSGSKAVISTETGYHNVVNTTDGHLGLPEDIAAKYIPRIYLEQFNSGIPRTLSYELIDVDKDPTDPEKNFGLLRNDGSEKPAFVALKNLIRLLKDSSFNFTPEALNYDLSSNASNLHHTLLEKHNGTFYLILWQEVSSFDVNSKQNNSVPNIQASITINQPISKVNIYLPNNSLEPIQQKISHNKLNLDIPDYPLVVEIKP